MNVSEAQGMGKVNELGYVGISSLDLDAWREYTTNVLGQEVAYDSDAENLFLKMDGHHHRLSVHPGEVEDVAFVGWEVGSADNMQAVAAQLDAADVEVIAGKPELAADRRVVDLVSFTDPHSGLRMELHYGPEVAFWPPFQPQRPITGFKTAQQGLGHLVTFVPDAIAAAEFYEEVLGFGVSDWVLVPGMGRLGAFMHCNTRHHSLAFFANPQPRKLIHHVMMEYTSIDDVGSAYDLARAECGGAAPDRHASVDGGDDGRVQRDLLVPEQRSALPRRAAEPDGGRTVVDHLLGEARRLVEVERVLDEEALTLGLERAGRQCEQTGDVGGSQHVVSLRERRCS